MITDEVLAKITERLVRNFQPERIILFGSQSRQMADEHSDVDILVICPIRGNRRALMVEMDRSLKGLGIARDIIVLTPEEFELDRQIPGTIARPAWLEGRVIYEHNRSRGVTKGEAPRPKVGASQRYLVFSYIGRIYPPSPLKRISFILKQRLGHSGIYLVEQWISFADEDLRLPKHGLKLTSGCPYRLIAYHAQQCVEKYLKGYLVYRGVDFPYTHNISQAAGIM